MKKEFRYRDKKICRIWAVAIMAFYICIVPEILKLSINATWAFINNVVAVALIVFVLIGREDKLLGGNKIGYYWKENGRTVIELGRKRILLNQVTELQLVEKKKQHQLYIRNNEDNVEITSMIAKKDTRIEDTVLYDLFSQILNENPQLVQEENLDGAPIEYWYTEDFFKRFQR